MLTGDACSSRHMVPSHLGLAYGLLVETDLFPKFSLFFQTVVALYMVKLQNAI